MIIRKLQPERFFRASDNSELFEWIHPYKDEEISNLKYSVAYARIRSGQNTHPHRLSKATETYIFVSGNGIIHLENESAEVTAGTAVVIPAGKWQWLENTGTTPLVFLCIVSPPWDAEFEELGTI
ncbi:MAG: cupin domain-containing protein [bacterium]|nr:cupin domain-containing protein [bacterium]